ncbi:MAG: hypothetical protein PHR96_00955 [Clostridia bacterium]|nr:hypothetical protein [Clostridia bacterium]
MKDDIMEFRKGDYFYHFGRYNGHKFVKITKMIDNKPTQQFAIWISGDIQFTYYDFNKIDLIGKNKMMIDKKCILFDALSKLTSENIKDINSNIVSKVESPLIVNDISSENYFQVKKPSAEMLELSFLFIDDDCETINIINIQNDLRSRIDQRRSNFKEVVLEVSSECQDILKKHYIKQNQDLQSER